MGKSQNSTKARQSQIETLDSNCHNSQKSPAQASTLYSAFQLSYIEIGLIVVVACLVLGCLTISICAQPIHFDELQHLGFIAQQSKGLTAHVDYWCHYPVLGYLPFSSFLCNTTSYEIIVFFRMFSILWAIGFCGLLILHCRSVNVSSLAAISVSGLALSDPIVVGVFAQVRPDGLGIIFAIAAIVYAFRPIQIVGMLLVPVLTIQSVVVMPKMAYLLASCSLVYAMLCLLQMQWKAVIYLACGTLLGFTVSELGCRLAGSTLLGDVYWSHMLMARYYAHCALNGGIPGDFLSVVVVPFISRNWILLALSLFGLGACVFFRHTWVSLHKALMAGGVAVGIGVTLYKSIFPFEQYLYPVALPLALVSSFALCWVRNSASRRIGAVFLALPVVAVLGERLVEAKNRTEIGLLGSQISMMNRLQSVLSEDDLVLSVPKELPFQKNLNFITFDEMLWGNPPGYARFIAPTHKEVINEFSAEKLERDLSVAKPAIIWESRSYSPEWVRVVTTYLQVNAADYVSADILGKRLFLRRDIAEKLR